MKHDDYTVNAYITNLATGDKLPFDQLPEDERLIIEEKMIRQMIKGIGYEITNIKQED